jgi:hypothetical protein
MAPIRQRPVEWNDHGFPDFLPPLQHTRLTHAEARERLEGVLKAVGIKAGLSVDGIVHLTFCDGAKYSGTRLDIECDGLSHQRG